MTMVSTIQMSNIIAAHVSARDGGVNWFAPEANAFFKKRMADHGYAGSRGRVWFATTEKSPHGPRKGSVRVMDVVTGSVETLGSFQGFPTMASADKAAKAAAKESVE